jgi:hypothetical protein
MSATAVVREKPILFSGEMVRAILDGRKTQTRRVITPQPIATDGEYGTTLTLQRWTGPRDNAVLTATGRFNAEDDLLAAAFSPHGAVGDRLWVRETWSTVTWQTIIGRPGLRDETVYRAGPHPFGKSAPHGWTDDGNKWRPSIFMPRARSRITLEITNVRVERVHDITEAEAQAEGVARVSDPDDITDDDALLNAECGYFPPRYYVAAYHELWDSLNAKRGYGWNVNPWVWVLEFRRVSA